jgi:transcriptional regulator with XRE-family HTH domain
MVGWAAVLWHIGDVVRKFRERQGFTRKQLAARAGVRQNTLGALEKNVSNFEQGTLAKIAVALNVTVDGLYAELPSVKLPPATDPVDAETISRFLQLPREKKQAIRVVVDSFGLFPDRHREPPSATDPADAHPHPARDVSGSRP